MKSGFFEPQHEIDELEHDRGDVGEHVLERIAEPANALVAEIVGQARDRRKRGHDEADASSQCDAVAQPAIVVAEVDDVGDERADEADDRERDQHRVDRVTADLRGAARVAAARFVMSSMAIQCSSSRASDARDRLASAAPTA